MSSITTSNKSSAVIQSLQRFTDADAFIYKLNESLPNHSREILSQVKTGITASAQNVVFDVVKAGILKRLWLKMNVNYSVAAKMATDHGVNWMNNVSLMNNNRTLETLFPQTIRAYIDNMPLDQRHAVESGIIETGAADNVTGGYDMYIPLPFSFSEDPTRYIDTNYVDSLKINLQLNALSTVLVGGTFTSAAVTLYGEYLTLDEESYSKYRDAQFPAGKPVEFLWSNSFQEPDKDLTAATSHTFDLVCDNVITETYVRIIDKSGTNDPFEVKPISRTGGMATIQLKGNGKVLYETNAFMKSCLDNQCELTSGAGAYAAAYSGSFKIDWSLAAAQLQEAYAGGLSLKNIAGPQLVINLVANAAATDDLQVMHKHLQFVKVEANSGRMAVSSAL